MIIHRNMINVTLQSKINKQTISGALKEEWQDLKIIKIAFFDKPNTNAITGNEKSKFIEYNKLALTKENSITRENHRIKVDNIIYKVIDIQSGGRFNQIVLKVASNEY